MDFGQKLAIWGHFSQNKWLSHFHMGYTHKNTGKKLFNFLLATELPFMHPFSKSWSVLISAKSGQFEFVVRFYAILGDFGRFIQKIDHVFFAKPALNRPKSPILSSFTTNSEWQESENTKIDQLFENPFTYGDLAAIWIMINFFFNAFCGITQVKVA